MVSRERAIELLAREHFDVAVIGGGVTGAGVALDAASRGYSVALLERADFASGTSSRSSKLIHGGLRYLQNFDLGLVREALLERALMVKLAPHLITPLPIVVATFDGARPDRMTGIGLNMYDVMATPWRGRYRVRGRRNRQGGRRTSAPDLELGGDPGVDEVDTDWSPARHRVVSGDEVVELLPALSSREPTGGYLFYDCQTDDSRLVLTILGEAERFGAICANRMEVVEVSGDDARAEPGVRARDAETGAEVTIRAENVVNATGVWADRIRPDELHSEAEVPSIVPSRGTHVILAGDDVPLRAGAIVPAGEGRSVFALPWLGRTLVGTTDDNHAGEIEHVRPAAGDVAYLLEATNSFFGTTLSDEDLCGAYAGVRPLISSGDTRKSVDISRKAELYETSSGMITITGGKLTTWRRMAKLTVDRLVERDGRDAPCRTHEIPLGEPVRPESLPRVEAVADDSYRALADRYGHAAGRVLETAAQRPELAERIVPGLPDLLAEATFSARHEQARSVGDVLLRRTRLGVIAGREVCAADSSVPGRVARALAEELGWDERRIAAELARFGDEAEAEGIAAPGAR
jgi:glycerol-3-phosphate dehydrogenase